VQNVYVERARRLLVQTDRDAEIVGWVGGLGAAGAEHVMGRFAMGRSWAYERLSQLTRDGLLEQRRLLYGKPGLYVATTVGLRWRGLGPLGVHRVRPGGFEHAWQAANVAVALYRALPAWSLLSDREIRWREREDGELLASVRVGSLPGGAPALHRPDLALVSPGGRTVAVEVELSVKARARLVAICRALARARHLARTYYLAAPAAGRAVSRAVSETRAGDRVTVLGLDQIQTLTAIEREEASHGDR
jgi:hypothetical protein